MLKSGDLIVYQRSDVPPHWGTYWWKMEPDGTVTETKPIGSWVCKHQVKIHKKTLAYSTDPYIRALYGEDAEAIYNLELKKYDADEYTTEYQYWLRDVLVRPGVVLKIVE